MNDFSIIYGTLVAKKKDERAKEKKCFDELLGKWRTFFQQNKAVSDGDDWHFTATSDGTIYRFSFSVIENPAATLRLFCGNNVAECTIMKTVALKEMLSGEEDMTETLTRATITSDDTHENFFHAIGAEDVYKQALALIEENNKQKTEEK